MLRSRERKSRPVAGWCALTIVALLLAAVPAYGGLTRTGPVVPAHGFPHFYEDETGLQLELCLDGPPLCLEGPPNPLLPPEVGPTPEQSNFPDEAFWWAGEAAMDTSGGGALLVLAQEAAFLEEEPEAGQQMSFARVRIRVDVTQPGHYTVTHPYGVDEFDVTTPGIRAINMTEDIGCAEAPCNFDRALTGRVGPFLRWDPNVSPAAPAGYVGDPGVDHEVVGSPLGTDYFRIEGPGIGPNGEDVIETRMFAIQGKLAGPPTALALTNPRSVDFGGQRTGTTSAERTVTLRNGGTAPMTVTGVSTAGADASAFDLTGGTCTGDDPVELGSGASCTATVAFAPDTTGDKTAQLQFESDQPNSPHAVALAGRGTAPAVSTSPASLTFNTPQKVNTTSPGRLVTVTNSGDAPLNVSGLTTAGTHAGDFAVNLDQSSCGDAPVAPGQACSVAVTFKPTATGARSGALRIASDAPNSPASVPLSGTGVAPAVAVDPASVDFGIQAVGAPSGTRTVTVSNTGDASLVVSGAAVVGADEADFAIDGNTCTAGAVAPGGTCTIGVRFTPGGTGARSATLRISSDDPASPKNVPLSGEGARPEATLSTPSISYGTQKVGVPSGYQMVTVSSTGTAPLAVGTTTIGGTDAADFEIDAANNECAGVTLAPGSDCQVPVRFKPSATGDRSGSLRVTTNAAGSPHTVALSGTGAVPAIAVSPTSINFGRQRMNSTSAPRAVTVTNTGPVPLVVGAPSVDNAAEFPIVNGCTAPVPAGGSCTIEVRFRPSGLFARNGVLTIPSDAPGAPKTVTLTGSGWIL